MMSFWWLILESSSLTIVSPGDSSCPSFPNFIFTYKLVLLRLRLWSFLRGLFRFVAAMTGSSSTFWISTSGTADCCNGLFRYEGDLSRAPGRELAERLTYGTWGLTCTTKGLTFYVLLVIYGIFFCDPFRYIISAYCLDSFKLSYLSGISFKN